MNRRSIARRVGEPVPVILNATDGLIDALFEFLAGNDFVTSERDIALCYRPCWNGIMHFALRFADD